MGVVERFGVERLEPRMARRGAEGEEAQSGGKGDGETETGRKMGAERRGP